MFKSESIKSSKSGAMNKVDVARKHSEEDSQNVNFGAWAFCWEIKVISSLRENWLSFEFFQDSEWTPRRFCSRATTNILLWSGVVALVCCVFFALHRQGFSTALPLTIQTQEIIEYCSPRRCRRDSDWSRCLLGLLPSFLASWWIFGFGNFPRFIGVYWFPGGCLSHESPTSLKYVKCRRVI